MLILVQMYRMAWQPFFMRFSEDPDASSLFGMAFKYFNIAAALVFLTVGLFVESIVAIPIPFLNTTLIDEAYWPGLSIVPWLLLAYWFQGWYINFSVGVFIQEKTKRLAQITGIGAIITIIVNVALIPVLGMKGAAIATLLSYGTMAVILYQVAQKPCKFLLDDTCLRYDDSSKDAVWGAQSLQMWIDLPKGLAGFLILALTMLVIIPLQVVGEGAKVDSVDTTLVGVAKKRPK